eukprot:evm.model.scf_340.6 EVM.evm.TU.scf_340.6   scf_340:41787-44690(-)
MAATLALPDGPSGLAVRAVLRLCGRSEDYDVTCGSADPVLDDKAAGVHLKGADTVCRYLVSSCTGKEADLRAAATGQLLGCTPILAAQVSQWLAFAHSELSPLTDDKLDKLNAFLAPRVFLVGTSLTLADICIFVVVHKAVTGFPVAQTKRFCNLLRWHDLMLNIAEWSGIIATVPLRKPVFDFTPPQPPPPQPKAPKTDPGQAQQADSKASSKAESKAAKKSSAVEATKT